MLLDRIVLQCPLRFLQVEFEGSKHEIQRLQEDVEVYQQQVEELMKLKAIAEKQLKEALQSYEVRTLLFEVLRFRAYHLHYILFLPLG